MGWENLAQQSEANIPSIPSYQTPAPAVPRADFNR